MILGKAEAADELYKITIKFYSINNKFFVNSSIYASIYFIFKTKIIANEWKVAV